MDVRDFVDHVRQKETPRIFRGDTLETVKTLAQNYMTYLNRERFWRIISFTAMLPIGGAGALLFFGGPDKPLPIGGSLILIAGAGVIYMITHRKSLTAHRTKLLVEIEIESILRRFRKAGELIGEPGILHLNAEDVVRLCTEQFHRLRRKHEIRGMPINSFKNHEGHPVVEFYTTFLGLNLTPNAKLESITVHESTPLSLAVSN